MVATRWSAVDGQKPLPQGRTCIRLPPANTDHAGFSHASGKLESLFSLGLPAEQILGSVGCGQRLSAILKCECCMCIQAQQKLRCLTSEKLKHCFRFESRCSLNHSSSQSVM